MGGHKTYLSGLCTGAKKLISFNEFARMSCVFDFERFIAPCLCKVDETAGSDSFLAAKHSTK
jgi:hypothetical protein